MDPNKLKQLMALAGLQSQLQQPQIEQQQANDRGQHERMGSAMQLLGLLQQQQENQGQQQYRSGVLANDQAKQKEDVRYHDSMLEKTDSQGKSALKSKVYGDYLGGLEHDPNITGHQRQSAYESLYPELGSANQAMHQVGVQDRVAPVQGQLQSVYNQHHNDIGGLNKFLSTYGASIPQEVWNGVNWDQLNQSLPAPTPKAPSSSSFQFDPYGPTSAIIELLKRSSHMFPASAIQ